MLSIQFKEIELYRSRADHVRGARYAGQRERRDGAHIRVPPERSRRPGFRPLEDHR